jgi:hypothetical protein
VSEQQPLGKRTNEREKERERERERKRERERESRNARALSSSSRGPAVEDTRHHHGRSLHK